MGDLPGNIDTDQKQFCLTIVVIHCNPEFQISILSLGAKAWFLFDLENLQLFANSEPFFVNKTGWFHVSKTRQGLDRDFILLDRDFNESIHVIGNNCLYYNLFSILYVYYFSRR